MLKINIKPGILVTCLGFFLMLFALMSKIADGEKIFISVFSLGLMIFGILMETPIFDYFRERERDSGYS